MVFGGVNEELLQLNESTLWSGGPANLNPNPKSPNYLPQIRKAIFNEDYQLADSLARKMQGLFTESYEPLGDVIIKQNFAGTPTDYYRELNLADAVTTTRFKVDNVEYTREIFASAPDQLIVVRLKASKRGKLNCLVTAKSLLHYKRTVIGSREMALKGKAPSFTDPNGYVIHPEPIVYSDSTSCRGMRFELRVRALPSDGKVITDTSGLHVSNATEIVLLLSAATSFNGFEKCPDKDGKNETQQVENYLNAAAAKPYTALKKAHLKDYQTYFDRVYLSLNENKEIKAPITERLKRYASGAPDSHLEALYLQFGRYLLISCSRQGGQPASLQGLWNPQVRPAWSSNYTININTQMNYWPAEVCNLSEMHEPLFELIKKLAITGKETTNNFYGLGGWTAHHNTDLWVVSNPVGDLGKGSPLWADWAMAGPWLSRHLYEHSLFTGDRTFLRETAYPLMKGTAQFCLDWLVEDSEGRLVTAPSTTPENVFMTPDGKTGAVSQATTMDMSIIWDLFTNLIEASETLGTDEEFRQLLMDKRKKLYPLKVGKNGGLQEWFKDFRETEPEHRHVSHLFGLHPGRQISSLTTPSFAQAARKTLELRGDGGTGWSRAWKINFWARLNDGNHAYKLLRELLRLSGDHGTDYCKYVLRPSTLPDRRQFWRYRRHDRDVGAKSPWGSFFAPSYS
jgi:alpha-L-fucosidase 2